MIDCQRFLVLQGSSANTFNTKDSDHEQEIDDLRALVTHSVACVFEIMARNDSLLELMADGGPFVRDLTGKLLRRLDR
jgi:hypothetical protein